MKIVLASESANRKRGMDFLGLTYETKPSHIDESLITHDDPIERVRLLSEAKAREVSEEYPDAIIIAGDMIAYLDGETLEKPKDKEEGKQMLRELSGNTFESISGVAVYNSKTKKMLSTGESCKVKFRELTDFDIDDYADKNPITQFAGAYDSNAMKRFAERVEGTYNFTYGISIEKIIVFLREQGVKI